MIDQIQQCQQAMATDGLAMCAKPVDNHIGELTVEEQKTIARSVAIRQNTYSTGRFCAKSALLDIGVGRDAYKQGLLRQEDGSVNWPDGTIGSISHTNDWAIAVAGKSGPTYSSVGVDIEQIDRVDKEVLRLIATDAERVELEKHQDLQWGRVALFSIKESIYKCLRPLYGDFIRFKDVQLANLTAPLFANELSTDALSSDGTTKEQNTPIVHFYQPTVELLHPALTDCCEEDRIVIRLAILPTHVLSLVLYHS